MLSVLSIPALLTALVGLLLGLAVRGASGMRSRRPNNVWKESSDRLLVGMLALAAFASGVFVTYVLMAAV